MILNVTTNPNITGELCIGFTSGGDKVRRVDDTL
jgi:hypothetical protein